MSKSDQEPLLANFYSDVMTGYFHSLNNNSLTETGALHLLSLMNTCERVAAVKLRFVHSSSFTFLKCILRYC